MAPRTLVTMTMLLLALTADAVGAAPPVYSAAFGPDSGIVGTQNDPSSVDGSAVRVYRRNNNTDNGTDTADGAYEPVGTYAFPGAGASVALHPAGRWAFSLTPYSVFVEDAPPYTIIDSDLYVHDALRGGRLVWHVTHRIDPDDGAGHFVVTDAEERERHEIPDCAINATQCYMGAALRSMGGDLLIACSPRGRSAQQLSVPLGCVLTVDADSGRPTAASPVPFAMAVGYARWTVIDAAAWGDRLVFLFCASSGSALSGACFPYFSFGIWPQRAECANPTSVAVGPGGVVAVGCPDENAVRIFACSDVGGCHARPSVRPSSAPSSSSSHAPRSSRFTASPSSSASSLPYTARYAPDPHIFTGSTAPSDSATISGFGSRIALSAGSGLLAVGASDGAFIYRPSSPSDPSIFADTPELRLPDFRRPASGASAFAPVFVSDKRAVILPSSFSPTADAGAGAAGAASTSGGILPLGACSPGTSWASHEQRCAPCAPGRYKPTAGFGECALCPDGTSSDPASPASCAPCPNATGAARATPTATTTTTTTTTTSTTATTHGTGSVFCPAGSPSPLVLDDGRLEYARTTPEIGQEVRVELEALFYESCWPLILYAFGGTLLVACGLWIAYRISGGGRRWKRAARGLSRVSLFLPPEDAGGGRGARRHGGRAAAAWMGPLATLFFAASAALLIAFSLLYVRYSLEHADVSFQVLPNDHRDAGALDRPNLAVSVSLVHGAPGSWPCSPDALPAGTDFGPVPEASYSRSPDGLRCDVALRLAGVRVPDGGSVFLSAAAAAASPGAPAHDGRPPSPPPRSEPFYVQAVLYSVSADYRDTPVWDWEPPTAELGPHGSSETGGAVLPPPGRFLAGPTTVSVEATRQLVQSCREQDEERLVTSATFWTRVLKTGKMRCANTSASARQYSVVAAFPGSSDARAFGRDPDPPPFSFSVRFSEAPHYTRVLIMQSTAYSEVLTVAALVLLGFYHVCHVAFVALARIARWADRAWARRRALTVLLPFVSAFRRSSGNLSVNADEDSPVRGTYLSSSSEGCSDSEDNAGRPFVGGFSARPLVDVTEEEDARSRSFTGNAIGDGSDGADDGSTRSLTTDSILPHADYYTVNSPRSSPPPRAARGSILSLARRWACTLF